MERRESLKRRGVVCISSGRCRGQRDAVGAATRWGGGEGGAERVFCVAWHCVARLGSSAEGLRPPSGATTMASPPIGPTARNRSTRRRGRARDTSTTPRRCGRPSMAPSITPAAVLAGEGARGCGVCRRLQRGKLSSSSRLIGTHRVAAAATKDGPVRVVGGVSPSSALCCGRDVTRAPGRSPATTVRRAAGIRRRHSLHSVRFFPPTIVDDLIAFQTLGIAALSAKQPNTSVRISQRSV